MFLNNDFCLNASPNFDIPVILRESPEVRGVEGLERNEKFNDWEGKGKGRMVGGR